MVHYPQEVLEEKPLLLICLQRFDLQYVNLFIFSSMLVRALQCQTQVLHDIEAGESSSNKSAPNLHASRVCGFHSSSALELSRKFPAAGRVTVGQRYMRRDG